MLKKCQVLVQLQPFLQILLNGSLNKMENTKNQRFANIRTLCEQFSCKLILLGTSIFILATTWFCFIQKFQLEVIAQPFSILLGVISMTLIHISIISNGERVKTLINSLEEIIENRKNFNPFEK